MSTLFYIIDLIEGALTLPQMAGKLGWCILGVCLLIGTYCIQVRNYLRTTCTCTCSILIHSFVWDNVHSSNNTISFIKVTQSIPSHISFCLGY